MKKKYTNQKGRLTEDSLKTYIEAMTDHKIDHLPEELYSLVQKNPELLRQVILYFEKFKKDFLVLNKQAPTSAYLEKKLVADESVTDYKGQAPNFEYDEIKNQLQKTSEENKFLENLMVGSSMNIHSPTLGLLQPTKDQLFVKSIDFKFKKIKDKKIRIAIYNHETDDAIIKIETPVSCSDYTFVPYSEEMPSGLYYCKSAYANDRANFVLQRFYFCTSEDKLNFLTGE